MAKVNLDALIRREDFEVTETRNSGKKKETLSIEDMKSDSFFFSSLRKPDFQRETNEWDSTRVMELMKSFISDDLIPAVILWRSSGGYLFVIDGSHRLSALSAWVNDDYGDNVISKEMYDGIIPEEQIKVAEDTRRLVNNTIGSYSDYKLALSHPEKVKENIVENAKNLGALAIQVQWVEGDAKKAENSFFKINQQAAPIDKTELRLLENRRKPYSIASRAIIRGGKGHKYWSGFPEKTQNKIQEIATEINQILFEPIYKKPVKTLDLPIAGRVFSSQSLSLITDSVMIINNIKIKESKNKKNEIDDDISGDRTLDSLKEVRKIMRIINSQHSSSLGLHPAVYFYSNEGRHKTASFLATIEFVMRLYKNQKLNYFTDIREQFERVILGYDYLTQQIVRKYRTSQSSYEKVADFFFLLMDAIHVDKDNRDEDIINIILNDPEFDYLTTSTTETKSDKKNFSREDKSSIYLNSALPSAPVCRICKGYIHTNSISIDHINRKRDGGDGKKENGQISHPYCNSGYKN
ncbi:GmrSD restriction endonuclease domain-containing protein [Xenorhabdus bovienii]|uniref:GmrSD restriction endonuclease domain-containing protein n=1 Tax=Xenorhabdus bovienii TaxID=40576 RepID=UPI00237CF24D|nr:DUF262 domain-containing protein [Xenorhabdus bovienii]MDE1492640.1 HNH endonuclease [Xenorhabdus bovienii]